MDPSSADSLFGLPSCPPADADAVVVPLPLEKTVSYGVGTAGGPKAILEASCQVDLFDEETLVDFSARPKIHTLPPLAVAGSVEDFLAATRQYVAPFRDQFVVALGGEHTVTYGVVDGLVDDPAELTIVHIDAHADLLDTLNGLYWSHGTVMRRLWERGCRLVQLGVRSLARSEYDLATQDERIVTHFAHQFPEEWPQTLELLARLEGKVYLTVDVDGLDPSVIPSTGTPQPNGLSWKQMMEVLRCLSAARKSRWIGADVVELVPSPHPPGCDPIAARLVAKILAHWWSGRSGGA